MKTLEELREELTRLREEVNLSIVRYDPRDSSYVPVHSTDPPYAYWVLGKPLMQMYEVRRQIFLRIYLQEVVDNGEEA